ncbi:transmembrane channel-like protein 4 isoform X2 [Perognathus longimembris pacificus]|uniref:transmembrane channel-like protein 4 isoform X2 n=1 Tax=Perognathus longimembris pacificus TaxID=214514 RepID=UPI002019A82B|nr:transmembrane channel-like protein 4 isoform X2 [Perognathus longimembris pacificus]
MEENPAWYSEAWVPPAGWTAPLGARGGRALSSVLNELPSAATLRYRGPGVLPWGALEEENDGGRNPQPFPEVTPLQPQDPHPSRELPWPMQARRTHRKGQAKDQAAYTSGSRAAHWARLLSRSKEKMKEGMQNLQPWAWTLKKIGGQFGGGTASYFSLLRFLVLLNVVASVFEVCMKLLPTWLEGAPPGPPGHTASSCGSYSPHTQGLVTFPTQIFNLLSGEGYLEWSPLFYGFYPPRPTLALTYLCSVFASGLICLLLILRRSVSGLRQTLLAESEALTSYSHRVFSAWDFGLCGDENVRLRQRNIRYELQETSLVQQTPLLKLVVDYLPSIFISGVNFILPPVFKLMAPLEGYTQSHQIILILLRTVTLRFASLLFLLISLWNQITCGGNSEAEACQTCGYNYKELPCWETKLGQEMYKLLLFDLLTGLAVMLLIQFPRKILCGLCPGALGRLAGTQEFQVPDEVLGLLYAQTVVWVGSFFCPLLPLLNTAKFLLLFCLKKLTLFSTCSPASRTFRASTANLFFPLVLLLGLAISAVTVLYSIFLIPPSKLCGPFRGKSSIWVHIPESIENLPQTAQNFLFFLGSQAFAVPFLLLSSILMTCTVALANSYGRLISEFKRQIEREAQNKVFLAQRAVALSSANGAL